MSSPLPDPRDYAPLIISQFGSNSWDSLSRDLRQLIDADQGRHWRHTLKVVAGLEALLAGPQHPEWEYRYGLLHGEPELIDWIARSKQQFDPDLLRVMALLHDLGKGINLARHEETSFRLLRQAVGDNLTPGSNQALVAVTIRHHAALGVLRSGQASPVILLSLIEDRRRYKLDGEELLTALILLMLADWTAYNPLSVSTMRRFLAYADNLRRDLWGTRPVNELKQCLWQEAMRQTPERLSNVLLFAFMPQPAVTTHHTPDRLIETTLAKLGLNGPEFQSKFALVRLDGAYAVFERCLALTPSPESYVAYMVHQLGRWLPTADQVRAFEAGPISFTVNLRPITQNLDQKSLARIQADLAKCTLTAYD